MIKKVKKTQLVFLKCFMGAAVSVFTGCTSLLYVPTKTMYVDKEKLDPPPEEWLFSARGSEPDSKVSESDGKVSESGGKVSEDNKQILRGWYFSSAQKSRAVVVYFHGNGQNRSAHFLGLYWLVKEGYDVFIFDYPGYGDVEGEPTPQNTVEAGKSALLAVKSRKPNLPMIIYGQSLGGAVAMRAMIELQTQIRPKLFVADATFLSYRSVARKILSRHWLTWLFQPVGWLVMSDRYAPGARVCEISTPMLVIHSKQDQVVDYELGLEVYKKSCEPKEFWSLKSGGHIETFSGSDMLYAIQTRKKFLTKLEQVLAAEAEP